MPCGLVTAALIGSLGMGKILSGTAFMFGFGFGTVPLMSMVALGGSQMTCTIRKRLRLAAPAIGIAIGVFCVLRGLALEIPQQNSTAASTSIECCP